MEAVTISHVSKSFGISTRMLRYYEQEGLIKSFREEGYAYRVYDEKALLRLRQIFVLRKLRIPLKQIKVILQKPDAVTAIEIFQKNIRELDDELDALATIRSILRRFVEDLEKTADIQLSNLIAGDDTVLAAIEPLTLISINFKEEKTMKSLEKAEEKLSKLNDVRIVYLPPATVAAAHHIGDEPEQHAATVMDQFVRESGLLERKPDIRHFGFNHPNPTDDTGFHGYEIWVTIPDDMQVPAPLVKKRFAGGLYAAHMIAMGNFNEWEWLFDWAGRNERYEFAGDMQDSEHMFGLLEEYLNYFSHARQISEPEADVQLDLLLPVRERSK